MHTHPTHTTHTHTPLKPLPGSIPDYSRWWNLLFVSELNNWNTTVSNRFIIWKLVTVSEHRDVCACVGFCVVSACVYVSLSLSLFVCGLLSQDYPYKWKTHQAVVDWLRWIVCVHWTLSASELKEARESISPPSSLPAVVSIQCQDLGWVQLLFYSSYFDWFSCIFMFCFLFPFCSFLLAFILHTENPEMIKNSLISMSNIVIIFI